ncbi:hypothetical protein ACNS7O_07895 [Haloferacaceae archaeon DSL9]
MATETASGLSDHARGVTVTTIACLAGLTAGLVSAYVIGTTPQAAGDTRAVLILAAFIFVQYPILKVVGVDVSDFGIKDNLFVSFMTFTLWFITFAVLLSSAVGF